MANDVTEWSSTAADNTSLGSVTLQENQMTVKSVNNAIRELMAQVAAGIAGGDFAVGVTDGDKGDIVVSSSGTVWSIDLTAVGAKLGISVASASGPGSIALAEDTDNGAHKITLIAPASVASDKTVTFQDVTGTVYVSGGTDVPLADGGTGSSLTDPNADRIMFWDDSAGAVTWLTAGTGLTITGTTIDASGGGLTLGTYTATTSGSTITFSSIPSGVKQITLSWMGSTNGTGAIGIQIGDSGGLENSGYSGQSLIYASTPSILKTAWGTQALLANGVVAANTYQFSVVLTLMDAATNTWFIAINGTSDQAANFGFTGAGNKSLSATLDRIAIITANTFDAGSVNIAYSS